MEFEEVHSSMKLPTPSLSLEDQFAEFDVWITPSLGEIRDSERFQSELGRIVAVFEILRIATSDFADEKTCSAEAISKTFVSELSKTDASEQAEMLRALASVLYLVTGKSDNNSKCQFPIYLRDVACWTQFPSVRTVNGKAIVTKVSTPRELKADRIMSVVQSLSCDAISQERLLFEFVRFVLRDDDDVAQLWSIGRSYSMLISMGREKQLLTPLVVFQVRGSVAASGGHEPEDKLRERMRQWGMEDLLDFNPCDVIVATEGKGKRQKTRAYDFTLPFAVPKWERRVFIQCQFYAGDSGSVSHKNVDQTTSSRTTVESLYNNPRFVEYVDGAGYFSSLNGDLKTLLSMENTASFFNCEALRFALDASCRMSAI